MILFTIIFLGSQALEHVSIIEAKTQIHEKAARIAFDKFEICDWQTIEYDKNIPMTIDGLANGLLELNEDFLIEGTLCGTKKEVVLVLDDNGLHGSILHEDMSEVILSIVNKDVSSVSTVQHKHHNWAETAKMKEKESKWRKFMEEHRGIRHRRNLQNLTPGSVDIHIHLDIDKHMVQTLGSAFAAARYGVELLAVINRDAYFGIGFNLKVVSVNVRTSSYLHNKASSENYLDQLGKIPRPNNVHLLHSLTTREIDGGIAWVGGLYIEGETYSVSGDLTGEFSHWDRTMVAHELGHNFGADHTHEMRPPIDQCGNDKCDDPISTIMSYCDFCPGGSTNIKYEFHPRVIDDMMDAYAARGHRLSWRTKCKSLSTTPHVGVPFYLKGSECLEIDTSNCATCNIETCERDSSWQIDQSNSHIVSGKDSAYCWSSSDCSSITLELCNNVHAQRFTFSSNQIVHESCGVLKFSGNNPIFSGSSTVASWCHPDQLAVNDFDKRECTDTRANPTPLACGQVKTGSSVNDCDGVSYFSFVGIGAAATVSTCNSNFDTTLVVQTDSERIATGDDNGNCGVQTVLEDLDLTEGQVYSIIVAGYSGATGQYRVQLTCAEPPIPPVPSVYACVFGCAETRTTCHKGERIRKACKKGRSACSLIECESRCDADDNCRYLYSNGRGDCFHYRDCTRETSMSVAGFTRQRVAAGVSSVPSLEPTMESLQTTEPTMEPSDAPTTELTVATFRPSHVPTMEPTTTEFSPVTESPHDGSYTCPFGCPETRNGCHNSQRISKVACGFEECQARCDDHSECRYLYSNSDGECFLYEDCSRSKTMRNAGFVRQRAEGTVSSTEAPTDSSSSETKTPTQTDAQTQTQSPGGSYLCMYNCEEVRRTCENDGAPKIRKIGGLSGEECEAACDAEDDCRFIFRNSKTKCYLLRSCDTFKGVRYAGITKQRIMS